MALPESSTPDLGHPEARGMLGRRWWTSAMEESQTEQSEAHHELFLENAPNNSIDTFLNQNLKTRPSPLIHKHNQGQPSQQNHSLHSYQTDRLTH